MRYNNKRSFGVFLALVVALVSPMKGQQQVRRISLDEAVRLFNQNNLELQLSRAVAREVTGAARQLRAFPNPTASVTHESFSNQGLSYSETYYTLTQPIDWPWRFGDRRKAGSHLADAASAELQADSALLVFELKRVYVEAAAAEAEWELLGQVSAVFRRADQNGTARLEEGDISSFEIKRIRVERARYEQQWMESELELSRLRRGLGGMTMPAQGGIQVAPAAPLSGDPPASDRGSMLNRALARRGEISAAASAAEAAGASANVVRWSRLPDPALTGGYKRQSDGLDGLFLGVAVPLPWWDRKGGDIAAAEARVEEAQAREQLVRLSVTKDVTSAAERFSSIERRAELIGDELLADANDLLDVALVSYDEGELSLLELLDAAQAYSDAGVLRARLNAAYWIAYYDLERAVGGLTAFDGQELEHK